MFGDAPWCVSECTMFSWPMKAATWMGVRPDCREKDMIINVKHCNKYQTLAKLSRRDIKSKQIQALLRYVSSSELLKSEQKPLLVPSANKWSQAKKNVVRSGTSVTAWIDAPCLSNSSITFTLFFLQAM